MKSTKQAPTGLVQRIIRKTHSSKGEDTGNTKGDCNESAIVPGGEPRFARLHAAGGEAAAIGNASGGGVRVTFTKRGGDRNEHT